MTSRCWADQEQKIYYPYLLQSRRHRQFPCIFPNALFHIPPRLAVAGAIGQLKSASSRRLSGEHPQAGFAWQAEYNLFTASESGLERMMGCVKAQKQPHAQGALIAGFEPTRE